MNLRAAGSLAATLLVASSLGACGVINSEPTGYNSTIRSNFVDACAAEGNISEADCGCLYEDISENVEFDEFMRIDKAMQEDPNATPAGAEEAFTHAFEECLS